MASMNPLTSLNHGKRSSLQSNDSPWTGTPTHIQLCSLCLFHTHTLSHPRLGNASSCQIARMICPYSLSCPVEKQTQWSDKDGVQTAHKYFFVLRHFLCILFISCVQISCLVHSFTIYCRECDNSLYEERVSKI